MYLENLVVDAVDPGSLGRFWEAALGTEQLSDSPEGYETRLTVPGGPTLDLCFQPVPNRPSEPQRLHLDLNGLEDQEATVERLRRLGATHADIGQGEVDWVVLADPEGNPFCVLRDRPEHADRGSIAAIPIDSADLERDRAFWAWLTGWTPVEDETPCLRHPNGRGPFLEFWPEETPKTEKNRLHLDIRLEAGEDAETIAAGIAGHGGREVFHPEWGEVPWRFFADSSGNDLCLLAARREDDASPGHP